MKINNLKGLFLVALFIGLLLMGAYFTADNDETVSLANSSKQQTSADAGSQPATAQGDNAAADNAALPANAENNDQNKASPNHHVHIDDKKLADIMRRHITPEMRDQINQILQPDGKPPKEVITATGSYLDLSDRASTVVLAFVEDDELVVTDITHPLPELGQK